MNLKFVVILILLLALANSVLGQTQCVLGMIDGYLFPGDAEVRLNAVVTSACPITRQDGVPVVFVLEKWAPIASPDGKPGWVFVSKHQKLLNENQKSRTLVNAFPELFWGSYRVLIVNGDSGESWSYQDAVHFTLGGTDVGSLLSRAFGNPVPDPEARSPRIRAAGTVTAGSLAFLGKLASGLATGFIYQLNPFGITHVVWSNSIFRQSGNEVWVDIPNNFNPTLPIYASVTADGGGISIQGVVYDPTDPDATFSPSK